MKHDDTLRLSPAQAQEALALGRQLAQLRKAVKMTQDEAALRAGLSRPTVARIEAGTANRTLSQILRYLDALAPGTSLVALLTGDIPALKHQLDSLQPRRVRKSQADDSLLDF